MPTPRAVRHKLKMKNGSTIIKEGSGEPLRGAHPPRPTEGPTPNAVAYALQNTSRLSPDEKEYVIQAVNLHAKLVAALEDLWESLPDKVKTCSIPATLYDKIEALLQEARGERR